MYINRYDSNTACANSGLTAEKRFKNLAESKGWSVADSTTKQNIYNHIDFIISHDKYGTRSVDVKARKGLSRGSEPNDAWVWLEFINVQGDKGWLKGEATHIAFERQNEFLLAERLDLLEWSKSIIRQKNNGSAPETTDRRDAGYKLYQRKGRKDWLTRVLYTDIIKSLNSIEIWDK